MRNIALSLPGPPAAAAAAGLLRGPVRGSRRGKVRALENPENVLIGSLLQLPISNIGQLESRLESTVRPEGERPGRALGVPMFRSGASKGPAALTRGPPGE